MAHDISSTDRHPTLVARIADRLTSRRGARVALALAAIVAFGLIGLFSSATVSAGHDAAPPDSESARASELLAQFPDADRAAAIVVAHRTDGHSLTTADMTSFAAMGGVISGQTGHPATSPHRSEDGLAAMMTAPMTVGADGAGDGDSGGADEAIAGIRDAIASSAPDDLTVQVTGGPAFAADVAAAFDGANVTLLAVTVAIVAILLILTYRSPILWILPLIVVGLADQVANVVTAAVGSALALQFDSGIISVLVFGAGTNYALLLLSRYREELVEQTDHRRALAIAWRRTVPAILASNLTVVFSLATLVLAVIPGTRGLGVASALGLLIAVAAVLLALPPVMAMCGRRVFWPFVPRPGRAQEHGRLWGTIARRVVRRPVAGLIVGVLILGVMGLGLIGTSVGLSQAQQFRGQTESAAGLETVAAHFPPGETAPIWVVTRSSVAGQVTAAARQVPGVVRATTVATARASTDDASTGNDAGTAGSWTKIMVTGQYAPGTKASLTLVTDLRAAVHQVPDSQALVGGTTATTHDARAGNHRDFMVLAPIMLAVSLAILMLVLRSVLAPVLLMAANVASATAAIGAGAWLARLLFPQQSLASQVPLLAFLFLVALGIDYTIFLAHRIRMETHHHSTREATVRAVRHTGGVITSAGIVLAGVFVALGVLPLVVLGQLGVIVGLGVMVDTLVVRTVVLPSLFALAGDRIWWPRSRRTATGKTRGGAAGAAGDRDRRERVAAH